MVGTLYIHGMVSGSVKRYTVCDASVTAEAVALVPDGFIFFLPVFLGDFIVVVVCPWGCIMNLGIVHLLP